MITFFSNLIGVKKDQAVTSAVEAEGQAWVEIAAGIDVNPATLSLA